MTKSELYQALKKDGAKLDKSYVKYSTAELQDIYNDRFYDGATEAVMQEKEQSVAQIITAIHTLYFQCNGWCEELGKSYYSGFYEPLNEQEYMALRKYASKEL